MVVRSDLTVAVLGLFVCMGCDSELKPEESFTKSCAGEVIPNCRPYEYAIVREGSVTPLNVEVGDPLVRIDVRIVFDSCPDAPAVHTIALTALDESGSAGPDGGATGSMVTLDTFTDGSGDDTNPAEGIIEANVENFFLASLVRTETDLVLAFEPRIDVCRGGQLELAYRTGALFEMAVPGP